MGKLNLDILIGFTAAIFCAMITIVIIVLLIKVVNLPVYKSDRIIQEQVVPDIYKIYNMSASAYTASIDECNHDIKNTAIMVKPKVGYTVAVSQDYLWMLGKTVYIKGLGVFRVEDLMANRYKNTIDVLVANKEMAKQFGKKNIELVIIK